MCDGAPLRSVEKDDGERRWGCNEIIFLFDPFSLFLAFAICSASMWRCFKYSV